MHGDRSSDATIQFAARFTGSDTFKGLFKEGMSLVEETASYLDTDGRDQSKNLTRSGSLSYATESMRLTTRLMQLASWLLLQRAVNEGEMTQEQARQEKNKVRIDTIRGSEGSQGYDELPEQLKTLVERSINLQRRIALIDRALAREAEPAPDSANPIARQLDALSSAFSGKSIS
jgi:regulator of CtrA degradation